MFLQHTHLFRESYSFLERNFCNLFSFFLPLLYPLKGDLYPNTTYTHSKCWECFWNLGSIGRCQGWRMQWAYCSNQKAREDTVRLNLVEAKSLEGLGALSKLGLEGLLLSCIPTNFLMDHFTTWRAVERFLAEFFSFLFDNTCRCYLYVCFSLPYSFPFNCFCVCD